MIEAFKMKKRREKIKSGIEKGSERIKASTKKLKQKSKEVKVNIETKIAEHKFFILILIILLVFLFYSYLREGIVFDLINSDIDNVVNFLRSFGTASLSCGAA